MLQETHVTNVGQIKTTNSEKYIWFELIRQEARLGGGGLAIGCLSDLKPIKTREGDDETECLTIKITVGECKIMVVNGYGPQLGDKIERKTKFWEYLEEEVLRADQLEMPIVIQLDSNAHLGNKIILEDPNPEPNQNGCMMKRFWTKLT